MQWPFQRHPVNKGSPNILLREQIHSAVLFKLPEPQEPGMEHFRCLLVLLGKANGLLSLIACSLLPT